MPHRIPAIGRRTLAAAALGLTAAPAAAAGDPLPAWRDGAAKRGILDFVDRTTRRGASGYLRPTERIAVFDNDGTLWVEQPLYTQIRLRARPAARCRRAGPRPRGARAVQGGARRRPRHGDGGRGEGPGRDHRRHPFGHVAGSFTGIVTRWLGTARHPRFDRPCTQLIYQPMLEVMRLLRRAGFEVWIVTGGGRNSSAPSAPRPTTCRSSRSSDRSARPNSACCGGPVRAVPPASDRGGG